MLWVILLGIFGLPLLIGGAALGMLAWQNLRRSSVLGRPLSRIGKLRPGCRRVRGKVVPLGETLRSFATDKECVYYRLRIYESQTKYKDIIYLPGGNTVARPHLPGGIFPFLMFGFLGVIFYRTHEELVGESRGVHSSRLLLDEEYEVPFVIEDETGCVEIDLREASVIVNEKGRISSSEVHPLPSKFADQLLEQFDIDAINDRGVFKCLNIVEEALGVGTKVTAAGAVETMEDGTLCFRKQGGPFVVSEREVAKEGREARSRAIGYAVGACVAVGVGLGCLLGTFALIVRASLVR